MSGPLVMGLDSRFRQVVAGILAKIEDEHVEVMKQGCRNWDDYQRRVGALEVIKRIRGDTEHEMHKHAQTASRPEPAS